ncbi:MAG: TonB family protein [Acidobacteriota bacterium]
MRGDIFILTAALSVAAHASFAAWLSVRQPRRPEPHHAIEMTLAPPKPKALAKVEPPPPPPPKPKLPPRLVKKLAPRPTPPAPAAPPPPETQKIGIDPDATKGGPALAAGATSEGEMGTGTTMEPTPPAPPVPPAPPAPPAKPAGRHFVPIFQVSRMPRAKHAVAPEIPAAFKDAQREALVVVEVELDEQGHVTGARVVRHAEFGLDDAALAAAKHTDFEPALVGTQPVPVRYQIPYRFRVRG